MSDQEPERTIAFRAESPEPEAKPLAPRLIVVIGAAAGTQVELGPEATTIGREGTNDLVLDSTVVSGLHAEVRRDGDEYVIVDCDSTNGVVVNGSRLPARTESPLQHGDAISISDHLLLFLCRDSSADRMDFSTIQIDKSRATREAEALLKEFPALRMRLES